MATKRISSAPQTGTQPTDINVMTGNPTPSTAKKSNGKRPTSFSIDPKLLIQFKAGCVQQGRPMSSVIEELMLQFLKTKC